MRRNLLKCEEQLESYTEIFDSLYSKSPLLRIESVKIKDALSKETWYSNLVMEMKRNRRLQFKRKENRENYYSTNKKHPIPRMKSLEKSRLIPNSDKLSPDSKQLAHRVLERKELNSSKNNKSSKITSKLYACVLYHLR